MDNLLQRTATACEKDPEKTFTYERHSRIHHFRLEKDEDEQRYVLHFGGNTQPIQTIEHIQTALYDTISKRFLFFDIHFLIMLRCQNYQRREPT